ncbi:MAG: glutathione S-transferase N-terminal domain-containing protein [Pseudomonadota bacterium]
MYKLYGALASPYSQKMRAVLRARQIDHIWVHGQAAMDEALSSVKAPVIPVLEYPDGTFANDTTPLIYDLEKRHTERSIVPDDPVHAFLAHLIEDFADEWLTKAMFGYRWLEIVDQRQMSVWLAFDSMKGGGLNAIEGFASRFCERQTGRMTLVGCTRENFPLIKQSLGCVLDALEAHVADKHCLFGSRPSLAEFGLFGQLSQLAVDPTAQAMMRADYPFTYRWLLHVDDMSGVEGCWGEPEELPPVVIALIEEIGRVYVPFLLANSCAEENGASEFAIEVDGLPYTQGAFKYQVKALGEIRKRYHALSRVERDRAEAILQRCRCMPLFS